MAIIRNINERNESPILARLREMDRRRCERALENYKRKQAAETRKAVRKKLPQLN